MDISQQQKNEMWLNKIRWKIYSKEIRGISELSTDCFRYIFPKNLLDEQIALIEFMENGKKLDSLNLVDFCNFY